jgi:glycosyltransferase involved in cell wall biosynthesis
MRKKNILISIITPSYNNGKFLQYCIDSIASQNFYGRIQHIVMDGGSTDDTKAILERNSNIIEFVSEKDEGFSDAVNKGLKRAVGTWTVILNSDDSLANCDVISNVLKQWNGFSDVLICGFNNIDENNNIIKKRSNYANDFNLWEFKTLQYAMPQNSIIVKTELLKRIVLEKEDEWAADLALWHKVLPKANIQKILVSFSTYREHSQQRNASKEYNLNKNYFAKMKIIMKYLDSEPKAAKAALAHLEWNRFSKAIGYKEYKIAIDSLFNSYSINPKNLFIGRTNVFVTIYTLLRWQCGRIGFFIKNSINHAEK